MLTFEEQMKLKRTNFRWFIVGLLFLITLVNYLDRASIAYAINNIAQEFHLSEWQVGLILGSFGVGYVFTAFLGGVAADQFGAKRTLAVSIFFWGVGSLFTGVATGFFMVFLSRIVLGLAEGPNFPAMTRAISDWLSEKERNRALSLALISVPIALALGGPIMSQLIVSFSWRGAYYFLTLLAVIWLPIWWLLFQDKPEDSKYVNQTELNYINDESISKSKPSSEKMTWRFLFFNKTLLVNNWSFFVFGYYLFFFMTWLPRYLEQVFHLKLRQIGFYSIAPWLLAAIMMWCIGVLADRIFKKTKSLRLSRSYPIFITQLLSALCIIPILSTNDLFYVLFFIALAIGFAMCANASYYAVVIDIAKERSGSALGIMDALFAIAGFLAPTLTGLIISLTGRFEAAFFLLAGLALSSAFLTLFYLTRRQELLLPYKLYVFILSGYAIICTIIKIGSVLCPILLIKIIGM
jgi:ACS family hexuronate transporter-like MFS transporter